MDRSGKETVLHAFTGADGGDPYAGVVRDAQGNLYGVTSAGALGQSIKSHRIDRRTLERERDVFEVFRFRSLEAVRLCDQRGDKALSLNKYIKY